MIRRRPPSEEPFTFDGEPLAETALLEDGQPQSNHETDVSALKESVAAHQAECGCHVVAPLCCDRPTFVLGGLDGEHELVSLQGTDSSGNLWHIDPLCKVRPEARR